MESIQTIKDRVTNLLDRYLPDKKGSPLTPGVKYVVNVPHIRAEMLYNNTLNPYRHRWCITMEKYGSNSLDNPYSALGFPNNILPVTQFRLDTYKIKEENIDLTSGYDITIPVGYEFTKSLSLTIYNEMDDNVNVLRSWLRAYRKKLFPSYKTTVGYKTACSKFTIYMYDSMYNEVDTYVYYGIPDLSDPSISNDEQGERSYTLNIMLLGEGDNNPNLPSNQIVELPTIENAKTVREKVLDKIKSLVGENTYNAVSNVAKKVAPIANSVITGNNSAASTVQSAYNYITFR